MRVPLTAGDVIYAWMVPAFDVKQDTIPGFVRDLWFKADREGTFRGQCAELCGKDHGFIPIVVDVVSAEKYTAWVHDRKKLMAAAADDPENVRDIPGLKSRGEKVYTANCDACHQANDRGVKDVFPAQEGSKSVTGPKNEKIALVLNGKRNTAMAAFGEQLSDVELAAVIIYTRNNRANKAGDAIQPADVKSQRK